jgi:hypothetical protein
MAEAMLRSGLSPLLLERSDYSSLYFANFNDSLVLPNSSYNSPTLACSFLMIPFEK